jgi:cytochrome c biogenesis protein CcmG/thiol:disulfide interchange protein DsbE
MRAIVLLPVLMFVLIAGFFAWALLGRNDSSLLPSALIDRPAPAMKLAPLLPELPGLDVAALRGEVAMVNIFASWCPPCQIEHPVFMKLARENAVPIWGINYKDKPEAATAWLKRLGNPYKGIGVDPLGRNAIEWGSYGVPETYVLDREGRIRHRYVGPVTEEAWRDTLAPIVRQLRQ